MLWSTCGYFGPIHVVLTVSEEYAVSGIANLQFVPYNQRGVSIMGKIRRKPFYGAENHRGLNLWGILAYAVSFLIVVLSLSR